MSFIRAYIKSMRLYYSFVTGLAGWVGVEYYQFAASTHGNAAPLSTPKNVFILTILFLSWGINQIVNDFLGIKEDRINAPNRPMVTGELDPKKALKVSGFLMGGAAILTAIFLQPLALIPLFAGVLLNIIYEFAKGYGIWGNISFGIMIGMCPLFGMMAAGSDLSLIFSLEAISLILFVVLLNSLLTYYTYFKDYEGDKAAGKKTLVVHYGLESSRKHALLFGFIPLFVFVFLLLGGFIHFILSTQFIFLAVMTAIIQIWNGFLYYKNPSGPVTYFALEVNFRAYCCAFATMISLFNPQLGLYLFVTAYIFIGFLFSFHKSDKG